jgi:hypothetical protein
MPSRPDYVVDLPDGGTAEYAFRVHPSATPGDISWTRRVFDRDGRLREVWHEVADATGRIVHSHRHR